MEEVETKTPGVAPARPVHFVGNLVTGRDAAARAILQSEIREAINVHLGHAVANRGDARVKADRGRIHIRVASFLKLAEAVPAQPQRMDQTSG